MPILPGVLSASLRSAARRINRRQATANREADWVNLQSGARGTARLVGWQYLVGAAVLAVSIALPAANETDEPYLFGVAVACLIIGAALHTGKWCGYRALNASITASIVVITVVVAVARPAGLAPLFYFWPLMLSAYYVGPRWLLLNAVLTPSLFGLALATTAEVHDPVMAFIQFTAVAVAVLVSVRRLRIRVAELLAEATRFASTDALTGALNRGAFEETFSAWQGHGDRRDGAAGALLMLDIDHFKVINDTHGHPAGDAALRNLSAIVRDEIRETDVFGRVGGEEFGVLLPATDGDTAMLTAERIRDSVAARSAQEGVAFTLSIGVADTNDAVDPWEAADRALYEAKHTGRDRVVLASRKLASTDRRPSDRRTPGHKKQRP